MLVPSEWITLSHLSSCVSGDCMSWTWHSEFILQRTQRWDWQLYTILEVIHHRWTRDGMMNTLFWKHCVWHRPSILIMSGTCASAACKERVIYEDWPILSHIMCCSVRVNTGVTGGALSHVIKWPSLINGSSTCRIKQFPVSFTPTQKTSQLPFYKITDHHTSTFLNYTQNMTNRHTLFCIFVQHAKSTWIWLNTEFLHAYVTITMHTEGGSREQARGQRLHNVVPSGRHYH